MPSGTSSSSTGMAVVSARPGVIVGSCSPIKRAIESDSPAEHDPAHRCPAAAVAMLVVRGRRPDLGFEGTIWDIPRRRASSESADVVVTVQLSPAEFEALRRIQTLDPADERLVYRSRHVGGLIEVSGTEDDLRSLAASSRTRSPMRRAPGVAPTSRLPSTASKLRWAIDELQGDLRRSGTYRPYGFETRPDCQPKGSRCVGRPHPSCPQ